MDRRIGGHLGHRILKGTPLLLGSELLQSHGDEAIEVLAVLRRGQGAHFLDELTG